MWLSLWLCTLRSQGNNRIVLGCAIPQGDRSALTLHELLISKRPYTDCGPEGSLYPLKILWVWNTCLQPPEGLIPFSVLSDLGKRQQGSGKAGRD